MKYSLTLIFLAILNPLAHSEPGKLTDFSQTGIYDFLKKNPDVRSKQKFLSSLPNDLKNNWIFMFDSESAQQAACKQPRLILQTADSKTLMGVTTLKNIDGAHSDAAIEITKFDETPKKNRFHYSEVRFLNGKVLFTNNIDSCKVCHGRNPRPNWDAYDSWGNQLPFNRDRLYKGSQEEKAYKLAILSLADDPVFKQLNLPKGVKIKETAGANGTRKREVEIIYDNKEEESTITLPNGYKVKQGGDYLILHDESKGETSSEGRGVALFDRLTDLNGRKIAAEIERSKNFHRFKYALKASIEGCIKDPNDWKHYVPETVLKSNAEFIKKKNPLFKGTKPLISELEDDTLERQKTLPTLKLELQKKNLKKMIRCTAKAEGKQYTSNELDNLVMGEILRRSGVDLKNPIVDREKYITNNTIAVWRFLLDPEGVDVDQFSTGVLERSTTFTFADLFGNIESPIQKMLESEVPTKDCTQLKSQSKEAFKKAKIESPENESEQLTTIEPGTTH